MSGANNVRSSSSSYDVRTLPDYVQSRVRTPMTGDLVDVRYTGPMPSGLPNDTAKYTAHTSEFVKYVDQIREFQVRPDDVWIITYPKCGTTWTQEMTWLLVNDLDYNGAARERLGLRSRFLEIGYISTRADVDVIPAIDRMPGPRVIKSHLPVNLLPAALWTVNPKIIYTARNAKDTALSYFHHYRGMLGYEGTFDDFLEAFLDGQLLYGDYFRHSNEFMELVDEGRDNILFLTYEEMKRDMANVLDRMCTFLGKQYTEQELIAVEHHLRFDSMKNNPMVNMEAFLAQLPTHKDGFKFMRSGTVGGHKQEFSEQWCKRFDAEIEKWNGVHKFDDPRKRNGAVASTLERVKG